MNFKIAFFFLLGLTLAFAAPGLLDAFGSEDNNRPPLGIPFVGEFGNALSGGGDRGRPGGRDNQDDGLSKIPFLGGFANALQEGFKGGQKVFQKELDAGKTVAKTGLNIAKGFVPFKLPF